MTGVAMADFTSHPRYAVINTLVQSLIQKVTIAQASYFAANRKYYQGIITPSDTVDGTADAGPNWAVKPTDQAESWKEFDAGTFRSNFKIPFQISIQVYQTSEGWGWLLMIEVWKAGLGTDDFGHEGNHWVYLHNNGPMQFDTTYMDKWLISLSD